MQAGFLDAEKPLPVVSAEELEKKFAATQLEAKRLRAILDPEETPYDSRYEERSILSALSKQAASNEAAGGADAKRARVIRALADGQLGRNFMDTEEPGSSQAKLESAIEGLEGVAEEAVAYVEALNNLGVVWCNRGETKPALELLERARAAHTAAAAPPADGAPPRPESEVVRLEDACTLTTFYLAQVYGNLGRRAESAAHVHETMRRQLARRNVSAAADAAARAAAESVGGAGAELMFGSDIRSEFSFDPQEWARNACDLSKYYATVARLDVAEHCLYAAESVLATARKADAAKREERAKAKAEAKAEAEAAEKKEAAEATVDLSEIDDADAPAVAAAPTKVFLEPAMEGSTTVFLNGTAEDKAEADKKAAAKAKAAQAAKEKATPSALTEDEAEAVAQVDLAWSKMWTAALKQAAELRIRAAEDADDTDTDEKFGEEEEKEGRALGPLSGLAFNALNLPTTSPILAEMAKRVTSFEGARELYKLGAARAARAKTVLVLDGFVTMHFEVIEAECDLYRQLALWEVDPARRHAMHKRRIDLIKPPLLELNEKSYTQLVRQGLFDISTIASEMLEIKVQMHAADPPPRRAKRLEAPVQLCVESCTEFINRFDEPKVPDRVEVEQERAYIQCHFHRARAYSKLDGNPESLVKALKAYQMLAKYLTRNQVEGSEEEAKVCEEMASLLPLKIAQAQRTAASA